MKKGLLNKFVEVKKEQEVVKVRVEKESTVDLTVMFDDYVPENPVQLPEPNVDSSIELINTRFADIGYSVNEMSIDQLLGVAIQDDSHIYNSRDSII